MSWKCWERSLDGFRKSVSFGPIAPGSGLFSVVQKCSLCAHRDVAAKLRRMPKAHSYEHIPFRCIAEFARSVFLFQDNVLRKFHSDAFHKAR